MERKSFHVKGFKETGEGICEFITSVFDNVDDGKDVVQKGAFAKVIKSQPRPPKFVPDHNWSALLPLGKLLEWKEVDEGLWCKAQFNLEKQICKDVYSDFKFNPEGIEFSFSYDLAENGFEMKDGIRYISEFSAVYDVGPVGIGMNRETSLLDVKALFGVGHTASGSGSTLDDSTELALQAARIYTERLKSHNQWLREGKESRVLSEANRNRLAGWSSALLQMHKETNELYKATAPKEDGDEGKALIIHIEHEYARFMGV